MTRFTIRYTNDKYRVIMPNYEGGEVVAAEDYDALLRASRFNCDVAEQALQAMKMAKEDLAAERTKVAALTAELAATKGPEFLKRAEYLRKCEREKVARECAEIADAVCRDHAAYHDVYLGARKVVEAIKAKCGVAQTAPAESLPGNTSMPPEFKDRLDAWKKEHSHELNWMDGLKDSDIDPEEGAK